MYMCTCRYIKVESMSPVFLQAQKSIELSAQKLHLLKLSLDNRLEEFPALAESLRTQENGDSGTPPIQPRPAQLTGTLYLKLLGVEGLLDVQALRMEAGNLMVSPPRTYSAGFRNFMTLPTPSRREREREMMEKEREARSDQDELGSSSGSSSLWPRRSSRHDKKKTITLQKQQSLDQLAEESSCMCKGEEGVLNKPIQHACTCSLRLQGSCS